MLSDNEACINLAFSSRITLERSLGFCMALLRRVLVELDPDAATEAAYSVTNIVFTPSICLALT